MQTVQHTGGINAGTALLLGQIASAVAAFRCTFVDSLQAVRAYRIGLGPLFCGTGELVAEFLGLVHGFDHGEHDGGNNQEIDDCADERAEVDFGARNHESGDFGCGAAGDKRDERVDDVVGERGHDCGERAADDDADCHIHYVAAADELFEFIERFFHVASSILRFHNEPFMRRPDCMLGVRLPQGANLRNTLCDGHDEELHRVSTTGSPTGCLIVPRHVGQ